MTSKNKGSQWTASSDTGAEVTLKQFQEYLKEQVDNAGGTRELARRTGLQASSISRVVNGEEIPSDYFLDVFGFKRRITIVKK